jgi:nucleoside-diphosphate-sugar epimerase
MRHGGELAGIAREKGFAGYVGDGSQRWPPAHRLDAARLFHLAVEKAPAGAVLHAVAEQVPTRTMAEIIGGGLDLPVASVAPDEAIAHFGFVGGLLALDMPALNDRTREMPGWHPGHPGHPGLVVGPRAGHVVAADRLIEPVL